MELFAVLAINAVISVALYYTITSKVTERIRTHMLKKINDEIRDFVDELETESMRQVDLIGSRILTFKEMTLKAEELVKRIEQATTPGIFSPLQSETSGLKSDFSPSENLQVPDSEKGITEKKLNARISGSVQQGIGNIYKENLDLIKEEIEFEIPKTQKTTVTQVAQVNPYSQKPQARAQVSKKEIPVSKMNEKTTPGTTSNLVLETIGKGVRRFFGIQEIKAIAEEESSAGDYFPGTRNTTLDISLDDDPFAPVEERSSTLGGTASFTDNLKSKESDFGRILQENVTGYKSPKPDSAKISAEAALMEIGDDATKIEKVVFLLKRKYSHEEISDALDLALGEVDIIERFRLDRNRRF
ncbi:hypothetical protein JWG45_12390 [Leptospira sp. 201903070]|jgi:hypothetical protein|uniref:Uncharacterized protein n=1 Tax=Leptospira ainlahdjerensis TaxID=2810033 RepID=A0ABS2UC44_9LEPT|nr:hypothetical protein [Leptospira ainlahdjerensis]MBM9577946.1 hypothetical protein [Leptospira ainlahdjerensis]